MATYWAARNKEQLSAQNLYAFLLCTCSQGGDNVALVPSAGHKAAANNSIISVNYPHFVRTVMPWGLMWIFVCSLAGVENQDRPIKEAEVLFF